MAAATASAGLHNVIRSLSNASPTVIPTAKRASVSAVLRVWCPSTESVLGGNTPEEVAASAASHVDAQLEMFFIKRTSHERDPWSGNVALPGGHRDPEDACDVSAAQREAAEEVGLPLGDSNRFALLGGLDQRPIYRGGRKARGFTMVPFVFLQLDPALPPLALQASEVAAAVWVPLAALTPDAVQWDTITRPLHPSLLPGLSWVPRWALEGVGATPLHFPSIPLPYSGIVREERGGGAASAQHFTRAVPAAGYASMGAAAAPLPMAGAPAGSHFAVQGRRQHFMPKGHMGTVAEHGYEELHMDLWGLTLGVASDVVGAARGATQQGEAPLNWPPISFPGTIPSFLASAVAGGMEWARFPRMGLGLGRQAAFLTVCGTMLALASALLLL